MSAGRQAEASQGGVVKLSICGAAQHGLELLSSGTRLLLLGEELLAKAALGARLSIHPPEAESDLKRAPRCTLQCSGSVHPTAMKSLV